MNEQERSVVTATAFRLVDAEGRLRAELASQVGGDIAELTFYDLEGAVRARLGLNALGTAQLTLLDATSNDSLALRVTEEGEASLWVKDKMGTVRLALVHQHESLTSLSMFNRERKRQVLLQLDEQTPMLLLADSQARYRAMLKVQPDERAGLAFYDQGGDGCLVAGVDEGGVPHLKLLDSRGGRASTTFTIEEGKAKLEILGGSVPPHSKEL